MRIIELIKRKRNAGCVRILCGAIQYSLLASAALGASELAAQSCNGGVCPTINVVGQMPSSGGNPTGGLGFLGRMDSMGWEWMNDGGGSIEQPPAAVLCPAVQATWDQQQCAGLPTAITANGCGSGLLQSMVIPQSFIGNSVVSFTDSCNAHDVCYSSPLANRYECDASLQEQMEAACNAQAAWQVWLSLATDEGLTGSARYSFAAEEKQQCIGQSHIYYGAVSQFGLSAFEQGQLGAVCRALKDLSNSADCGI